MNKELVGTYHRGDPFSSMNSAVKNNGRLDAFTSTSPEMDPSDSTPRIGVTCCNNFCFGRIQGDEVFQECKMVCIRMVCVEPSEVCSGN